MSRLFLHFVSFALFQVTRATTYSWQIQFQQAHLFCGHIRWYVMLIFVVFLYTQRWYYLGCEVMHTLSLSLLILVIIFIWSWSIFDWCYQCVELTWNQTIWWGETLRLLLTLMYVRFVSSTYWVLYNTWRVDIHTFLTNYLLVICIDSRLKSVIFYMYQINIVKCNHRW